MGSEQWPAGQYCAFGGRCMYKRKTYIINKEFQYGLIATFLLLVVCSLLVFSGGFLLYYMVTGLVGENAYDEFIEITQQVAIKTQPIRDENIVDPVGLAVKIQQGSDPVSGFIGQIGSWKTIMDMDLEDPAIDQFEVQKELTAGLNGFLQNLIRNAERFYTDERFAQKSVPAKLADSAKSKISLQSEEAWRINLQLLAASFPQELKIAASEDRQGLVEFNFQRTIPGLKRYEIVLPPVLINNLLLMVIIIIVGIFYSHRIAGPIYRMEQDIMRVLSGERNVTIRLRKKDKLKPLAEQINKLIHELEKTRGK